MEVGPKTADCDPDAPDETDGAGRQAEPATTEDKAEDAKDSSCQQNTAERYLTAEEVN